MDSYNSNRDRHQHHLIISSHFDRITYEKNTFMFSYIVHTYILFIILSLLISQMKQFTLLLVIFFIIVQIKHIIVLCADLQTITTTTTAIPLTEVQPQQQQQYAIELNSTQYHHHQHHNNPTAKTWVEFQFQFKIVSSSFRLYILFKTWFSSFRGVLVFLLHIHIFFFRLSTHTLFKSL